MKESHYCLEFGLLRYDMLRFSAPSFSSLSKCIPSKGTVACLGGSYLWSWHLAAADHDAAGNIEVVRIRRWIGLCPFELTSTKVNFSMLLTLHWDSFWWYSLASLFVGFTRGIVLMYSPLSEEKGGYYRMNAIRSDEHEIFVFRI